MPDHPVQPSPNPYAPPNFFEMDDRQFEEMSRALFDKEAHLRNADFYGTPGQKQYGIDIIADRAAGDGVEVISCKCYRKHANWQIKKFSDEFLEHWDDLWKPQGVRRFVLASAARTDTTQMQNAIRAEFKRFKKLGVDYEVWHPGRLQELLRPHRPIVVQYIGAYHATRICGSETLEMAGMTGGGLVNALLASQTVELQRLLAGTVPPRIERAIDRIRRGDGRSAEDDLTTIRTDPQTWAVLGADVQARVLRLSASCRLRLDDLVAAEALADEADRLCPPPDEPRLRALIGLRREGPEKALAVLGNPVSPDGVHLQVGLLIVAGRLDEAGTVLEGWSATAAPHAEASRLRALLALERNDRDGALAAVRDAERLEPSWAAVRETGGRVRYALAVSRAVPPSALRAPNPIDPGLILEDETARRLLTEADQAFVGWLEAPLDEEERRVAETWRLATLAARRHRPAAAADYAAELLNREPTHWGAIAWSLTRDYPFDRPATLEALDRLLAAGDGEAAHLIAAVWIELDQGRTDDARNLLDRHAGRFTQREDAALLRFWRDRLAVAPKDRSEAPQAGLAQALDEALNAGDWRPVADLLARLADDAEHRPLLLPASRALAEANRWAELRAHINTLAKHIATPEAIRLAAFIAGNTGAPDHAIELIEAYQDASGVAILPNDLHRLRAAALWLSGDIAGALRDAQELALISGEPGDLIRQAEFALQVGNLTLAELTIRTPAVLSALSGEYAVQWAGRLASVAPATSRRLLEHAVEQGLPDAAIPAALGQSLRLADERIIRRLSAELARLAAADPAGPVWALDALELPKWLAEARRRAEDAAGRHARGEIPAHIIAPAMGPGFADLFCRTGTDEAIAQPRRPPLLIQYGGRLAVPTTLGFPFAAPLHIDTTALLLAHGIGLLDVLDDTGAPLYLPSALPQAIAHLEVEALAHQPDRAAAQDAIRRAVAASRARSTATDGPAAVGARRAWRVVHGFDAQEEPLIEPNHAGIVPLRAVADALLASGRLDPERYAEVVARLEPNAAGQRLTLGDQLDFEGDALESLAVSGALEETLTSFDVRVDFRYLDDAAAALATLEERRRLADRLRDLRERVAARVTAGQWRLLPARRRLADEDEDTAGSRSAVELCLRELLHIPAGEAATLWIDDRFLSRYAEAQGHLIVGVGDILSALRAASIIDAPRHFAFLLRLRRARAHFLPVTTDEALHHLAAARIDAGAVIETPALRTLRQSFADTLELEPFWSLPAPTAVRGPHGELPLVLRALRLFDEVLLAIWKRLDLDITTCEAWSDWAWSALRAQRFARMPLAGGEEEVRSLAVQLLASPVAQAISLFAVRDGAVQRRCRALMAWLESRVLAPVLDTDPDLVEAAADSLAQSLAGLLETAPESESAPPGEDELRLWKDFLVRFVAILPDAIRLRLHANSVFANAIDLRIRTLLTLNGIDFDVEAFWGAVARVCCGNTAALTSADGKTQVRLVSSRNMGSAGSIAVTGGLRCTIAADPAFGALTGSEPLRRRFLEKHPEWFDRPTAERAALIAAVAAEPSAATRMRLLMEHRDRSVICQRAQRRMALEEHDQLKLAPPDATDLLGHLRLDPTAGSPADALAQAARTLVEELGPVEAVRRLAGLPIPPPDAVVAGFASLAPDERNRALGVLAEESSAPLGRLHVLALMRRFSHASLVAELDRLLADWAEAGDSFVALLRWTAGRPADEPSWRQLNGAYRLALIWTHAHQVTDALLAAGATRKAIAEFLKSTPSSRRLERVMTIEAGFDDSILNPEVMLDGAALLANGLASALGAEDALLLAPERRAHLETALGWTEGDRCGLLPSLLRDTRGLEVPFGSFLGQRPDALLEAVAGTGAGWPRVGEVGEMARAAVLARPQEADGWLSVHFTGLDRIAACPNLAEAIARLDVTALATEPDRAGSFVLQIAAGIAARIGNEPAHRFRDCLMVAAEALALRHRGPILPMDDEAQVAPPAVEAAQRLLEALGALAKRPSLAEAVAELADGLTRVADAWPNAAPLWRHVAGRLVERLPFAVAEPLWRTWVGLRSRA
ncbi:hypothetical protein [Azospirillum picis]|uniref:Restriction endonuclease type IV Mrr domain-containing protein n=1 Tax=Azospirillum picis TaxID=488438 RepID=A0ABU0MSR2_9PROT|nr:hypothetical protein [Azospirillum picis]MBP2302810.1 hypothetical protein [Azospirillum picis]MDQ0536528.1 hypothetical protein [Azospirillum picis]